MRFKLDENLPTELEDDLVRLGHDADSVATEGLGGADDASVVAAAIASQRILLTLDKGIASLLQHPAPNRPRVVLFRPDASGRRSVLSFVRSRMSTLLEMDLIGRLTVVGPSRIRMR
jgi:predicted nuclease of predicted toxin-antitoxin system